MHESGDVGPKPLAGAKTSVKLKPRTAAESVLSEQLREAADRAQRARGRLPRRFAAGDDTLRIRIEPGGRGGPLDGRPLRLRQVHPKGACPAIDRLDGLTGAGWTQDRCWRHTWRQGHTDKTPPRLSLQPADRRRSFLLRRPPRLPPLPPCRLPPSPSPSGLSPPRHLSTRHSPPFAITATLTAASLTATAPSLPPKAVLTEATGGSLKYNLTVRAAAACPVGRCTASAGTRHTFATLLAEQEEIRLLYFEQRAKTYIEEVLVPALGISVFYYVMEFAWARRFRDQGAAGRGQIHFHLLGWLESGEPHHIISVGNSRDSVVVTPLE